MCQIKELFFLDGETAMQLHPPEADYVNNHPYCLHLWRPHSETIPRPPSILVGIKSAGILQSPAQARALRQKMETKTS